MERSILFVILALMATGCAGTSTNKSAKANPYNSVKAGTYNADSIISMSSDAQENNIVTSMVKHGLEGENKIVTFSSPKTGSNFKITFGDSFVKRGVYCMPFSIGRTAIDGTFIDFVSYACHVNGTWVIIQP